MIRPITGYVRGIYISAEGETRWSDPTFTDRNLPRLARAARLAVKARRAEKVRDAARLAREENAEMAAARAADHLNNTVRRLAQI